MFNEITNADLVCLLQKKPKFDYDGFQAAALMDEAAIRIRRLERELAGWRGAASIVDSDTPKELAEKLNTNSQDQEP